MIADGRLTKTETGTCTLWHVTNYDKYQSLSNYSSNGTAERECRTPKTLYPANTNNGQTDMEIEVTNGGGEAVPNNNNNDIRKNVLLAEGFLNSNEIIFLPARLEREMLTWLKDYGRDSVREAFQKAALVWKRQGHTGDFLSYVNTVLKNDFEAFQPTNNSFP